MSCTRACNREQNAPSARKLKVLFTPTNVCVLFFSLNLVLFLFEKGTNKMTVGVKMKTRVEIEVVMMFKGSVKLSCV